MSATASPTTTLTVHPKMSENDLLKCVLSLAKLYGWRTFHARPAMTAKGYRTAVQGDGVGWPDIFAVRGERIVVAELKSAKGALTYEQEEWLAALGFALQANTYVWRPESWHSGEILRTLSEARG